MLNVYVYTSSLCHTELQFKTIKKLNLSLNVYGQKHKILTHLELERKIKVNK